MPKEAKNVPWLGHAALEFTVVFTVLYALSAISFKAAQPEDGEKQFLTLDDEDNFVVNDAYKGFTSEHLQWMWESKHLDVWEPVAWFLKACVWSLFELDANRWLDVQVISHAAGGSLLYLLCLRVFGEHFSPSRKVQAAASLAGAAFWTLHPLRAEVVGWISCISYNFGVNFVVGSLLAYHSYLTANNTVTKAVAYATSLLFFFLALACKTPAISTLFGFLFIDAFVKPKRLLPVKQWLSPFGAVTDKLAFVAVGVWVLFTAAPGDDPCENPRTAGVCLTVKDRFIRACWALGFYVRMTLWPEQHMPHYAMEKHNDHETSMDFDTATYLLPSVVIPAVTAIAIGTFLTELWRITSSVQRDAPSPASKASATAIQRQFSTSFIISAAWVFYVTWSLPAIGIVQHGVLTMGADRYHYLPALVVAPVVGALYSKLHHAPAIPCISKAVVGVSIFAILVLLTRAASRPWTNTVSLYTNAQRFRATNTGFALNNFGYWYYREENWPLAVEMFEQALMQEPNNIKGIINLADIFSYHQKDWKKTAEHYEKYIQINPRSGSLVNNVRNVYDKLGDSEAAEYHTTLVPQLQFDWGQQYDDDLLAWAFRARDGVLKHHIEPNGMGDRSPLQIELNASCWRSATSTGIPGSSLNCLPSFVVIGAPRSGSTTLFDNLKKHPRLLLWDTWDNKELNFLNSVAKYDRYYAEALPPLPLGLDAVTGEASVRYFMHPQVPRRMFETAPHTKLVVTVRNPIFRAFSHWRMERFLMEGRDSRETFQDAVIEEMQQGLQDPSCLEAEMANSKLEYCYPFLKELTYRNSIQLVGLHPYLAIGIYHHQLWRWLQYFPIEQFVFVAFEDMDNDADGIQANVNAITDHIGVERVSVYDENNAVGISNQNNKGTDATMSIQLLRALQQFFQPHNERFYKMVGRDFGWEKQVDDVIVAQLRAAQQQQKKAGATANYGGVSFSEP